MYRRKRKKNVPIKLLFQQMDWIEPEHRKTRRRRQTKFGIRSPEHAKEWILWMFWNEYRTTRNMSRKLTKATAKEIPCIKRKPSLYRWICCLFSDSVLSCRIVKRCLLIYSSKTLKVYWNLFERAEFFFRFLFLKVCIRNSLWRSNWWISIKHCCQCMRKSYEETVPTASSFLCLAQNSNKISSHFNSNHLWVVENFQKKFHES